MRRSKRPLIRWCAGIALGLAALTALLFRLEIEQRLFYPLEYFEMADHIAEGHGVDTALLMALIRTESGFNPRAVSAAGARGLTQIMPETFRWLQGKTGERLALDELFEPEISIRYGALLLQLLGGEFQETETALAAYHAGRGRVNGWLADPAISPDGSTLTHIPIPATRHYVRKVMKAYEKYTLFLGGA